MVKCGVLFEVRTEFLNIRRRELIHFTSTMEQHKCMYYILVCIGMKFRNKNKFRHCIPAYTGQFRPLLITVKWRVSLPPFQSHSWRNATPRLRLLPQLPAQRGFQAPFVCINLQASCRILQKQTWQVMEIQTDKNMNCRSDQQQNKINKFSKHFSPLSSHTHCTGPQPPWMPYKVEGSYDGKG
jgi:hypothetical protein